VQELERGRPEAVAVVLLHSYAHPEHERMLGELIAAGMPGVHVSLSHELVGTFREYERAATTELDAALSPLLAGYLDRLSTEARSAGLVEPAVMQSSGGLTDCARAARHAAVTVLSGPAGGVGGALMLAREAGEEDVVCFDMGGTSCDVCVIAGGRVTETAQRTVAGRPLALPALDIHTVGAGGGSIAWRDAGGALRVGPRSAGADPGPASYGGGGELATVTDAHVVLGRLPAQGGLAGGVELDREAAERAVARLARELDLETVRCAEGIVRVAEAEMGRALRVMTVERGIDPRGMALMAFGGAGPLHAAALAQGLGIRRVLCPRASGVLSALGLAAAGPRRDAARTVMLAGAELTVERVAAEREALVERVCRDLTGEAGVAARARVRVRVRVRYELRYAGQSFELAVDEDDVPGPAADPEALREAFARAHEERYGYREPADAEVELVTIRVSAWGGTPRVSLAAVSTREPVRRTCRIVVAGSELSAEHVRGELPPGAGVSGPAVWSLAEATLFVPPEWVGEVDGCGTVHPIDTSPRLGVGGEVDRCGTVHPIDTSPRLGMGGEVDRCGTVHPIDTSPRLGR